MTLSCEEVWGEVSNYLEGDVDSTLRAAIEEHLRGCKHCTAVIDGTRNVITLYGDDRVMEVPAGFSQRLHRKLAATMPSRPRSAFGYLVAIAAAALLVGTFAITKSSATQPQLRSEHAQPGKNIPADLMVVAAEDGKTFHVSGCPFIHDKAKLRLIPSREATREGYVPCVRCMRKYLNTAAAAIPVKDPQQITASTH